MNDISLRQLEVFLAIVEEGSFTGASKKLYLAQSTVSTHIRSLEETLHTSLFIRDIKKRLIITDDGKQVYQFAKDIVSKCSQLESSLDEESRKEILIGASSVPSQELIPSITAEFLKQNPDHCCTILYGNSEDIQQMLIERKIQLGFIGTSDNLQALTYECIAEDHLVLVTSNSERYRSYHSQGVFGKELLREPFVFREANSATQRYADNYLNSLDLGEDINVVAYVSNLNTMLNLVEKGVGIAIVSYLTAKEKINDGLLLSFELGEVPLNRNIYMARLRKGFISKSARSFAELARNISSASR